MVKDSVYNDGTYIKFNPTLHAEDSKYKMAYIAKLLERVDWDGSVINILDIGGGAGELGKYVCEWFVSNGCAVNASVLDVAEEMINIQKEHNPYIKKTYLGSLDELGEERFDLVLMIDVIEHIESCEQFAADLNNHASYIVYNIPIEINLVDILRNIAMNKRYYQAQTESLGQGHFFSIRSAVRFISRYHEPIGTLFSEYALYVLTSPHEDYVNQRKVQIRKIELMISVAIQKILPWLAPYLVQGSLFSLVKSKTEMGNADEHGTVKK